MFKSVNEMKQSMCLKPYIIPVIKNDMNDFFLINLHVYEGRINYFLLENGVNEENTLTSTLCFIAAIWTITEVVTPPFYWDTLTTPTFYLGWRANSGFLKKTHEMLLHTK